MFSFATAINCIDGRVQKPVAEYLQNNFGVDYVDMITEPGPIKVLSEAKEADIIESLIRKVKLSVDRRGTQVMAIAGHHDCLANPETEEVQKKQLACALKVIRSWGLPVPKVIALWIDKNSKPNLVASI